MLRTIGLATVAATGGAVAVEGFNGPEPGDNGKLLGGVMLGALGTGLLSSRWVVGLAAYGAGMLGAAALGLGHTAAQEGAARVG
jgi:hypothetical protein